MSEGNEKSINHETNDDLNEENQPNQNVSRPPDLFCEAIRDAEDNSDNTTQNDPPKREENPFSFKHFLNNTGARPKVFSTNRQYSLPTSDLLQNRQKRSNLPDSIRTEYSLPDFVQDHLIVEQCYLGTDGNDIDLDNLPDFTVDRSLNNEKTWNNSTNDTNSRRKRHNVSFPLDLPLITDNVRITEENTSNNLMGGSRSCPQSSDGGVSKSLPDFLSDGPIYTNRLSDLVADNIESNNQSLQNNINNSNNETACNNYEEQRLRDELLRARQEIHDRSQQINRLERDIRIMREKEANYFKLLSNTVKKAEGNLSTSNKRAISAETTIQQLKIELKKSNQIIQEMRKENEQLRQAIGKDQAEASGYCGASTEIDTSLNQFIANQLRGAANSAEHTLRDLINGLNNLRDLANSLETNNYPNSNATSRSYTTKNRFANYYEEDDE